MNGMNDNLHAADINLSAAQDHIDWHQERIDFWAPHVEHWKDAILNALFPVVDDAELDRDYDEWVDEMRRAEQEQAEFRRTHGPQS